MALQWKDLAYKIEWVNLHPKKVYNIDPRFKPNNLTACRHNDMNACIHILTGSIPAPFNSNLIYFPLKARFTVLFWIG